MKTVMKFGGTSVGDGTRIKHVARLIKAHVDAGHNTVVVTSAIGDTTDLLLDTARKASTSGNPDNIKKIIAELRTTHHKAIRDAFNSTIETSSAIEVIKEINSRLEEVEKALIGICYLGELTARSVDFISSFGERLAAPILSGALRTVGLNSKSFTGDEAGIVTTKDYGNALPLERTYSQVKERLGHLVEDWVPVVSGFIARCEDDTVTTLGRGGSDFTASIIGAAIGADEIWLWKDVPGIMTADPGVVPVARTLPTISYIEAMEMSYFGAKVLHPRAIEPAIRHGIPVRVKNTFQPESEGTLVVGEEEKRRDVVKAVSVINDVALINVSGAGMIGHIGVAARIFTALAEAGVNIMMISQGSSEANISLVVDDKHLDSAVRAIQTDFKNGIVRDITSDEKISVIGIVGSGMAGVPGVAGRTFNALGRAHINVIMISQGSSQHNISFAVAKDQSHDAVRALHREFELDKIKI
ncbi:aspartate kinase, monofunctional class [Methanosarcinales archaeon ex4572_44]|nr:MAG: aspartate kinase, monofunctional class [Methanosarcinales archaeon ex4572_44]RLG25196.1 MAG: aspartate kinase [Methanosarcinales archaeon]